MPPIDDEATPNDEDGDSDTEAENTRAVGLCVERSRACRAAGASSPAARRAGRIVYDGEGERMDGEKEGKEQRFLLSGCSAKQSLPIMLCACSAVANGSQEGGLLEGRRSERQMGWG